MCVIFFGWESEWGLQKTELNRPWSIFSMAFLKKIFSMTVLCGDGDGAWAEYPRNWLLLCCLHWSQKRPFPSLSMKLARSRAHLLNKRKQGKKRPCCSWSHGQPAWIQDLFMGCSCHDSKNLNMINMLTTSSWASLRHKGASCACVLCFEFNLVYVWICAC